MRWFWQQRSGLPRRRSTLFDGENGLEETIHSQTREISLLTEPLTIETQLSNAESLFYSIDPDADTTDIHRNTILALKEGCTMKTLIKRYPDDVLSVLKEVSVAPLGKLEAKDSQVLAAFGREKMLTRGHNLANCPHWESDWRHVLEKGKEANANVAVGWEQNVSLGAYVVSLRDIAKKQGDTGDLLDLLLQKYTAGAASREIWEFPAVQAVINYHWHHWARRLLLIVFAFFLMWTLCFGAYLFLYIEHGLPPKPRDTPSPQGSPDTSSPNNGRSLKADGNTAQRGTTGMTVKTVKTVTTGKHPPKMVPPPETGTTPDEPDDADGELDEHESESEDPHRDGDKKHHRIPHSFTHLQSVACWTRVLDVICFATMCPFAIEEYWTMVTLGRRWLSFGNLLDIGAINLQAFIFVCHMKDIALTQCWFGYLLALQILFLSLRLLRFVKLLGGGTTFLDTALAVIYDARYWLMFIVFTGVSASFALAAVYKMDYDFSHKHLHSNFSHVWDALVTTFQIIFGNFDANFIFHAHSQWLTFLFFLGFQVLMTITILNLIIATMADSYSTLATQKVSQFYKGRAELIAELEGLHLPKFLTFEPAPFIHFLVVEKKQSRKHDTQDMSRSCSKDVSQDDLQKKMDILSAKVEVMMTMMATIIDRIDVGENGTEETDQE